MGWLHGAFTSAIAFSSALIVIRSLLLAARASHDTGGMAKARQ